MNEADAQILAARFEHVFNTSLSQLRVITAHVAPVASKLDMQSEERAYLVSGLMELVNLHMYLLQQMNWLATGIADPVAAAQAVVAGAEQSVREMFPAAETEKSAPVGDSDNAEVTVH